MQGRPAEDQHRQHHHLRAEVGDDRAADGAGDGVAGRERVPQFWAGHVVSAGDRLRAAVLVQKKSACPARL